MSATFQAFDRDGDRAMTATSKEYPANGKHGRFGTLKIAVDGSTVEIFTTPERAAAIADAINASAPAKLEEVA